MTHEQNELPPLCAISIWIPDKGLHVEFHINTIDDRPVMDYLSGTQGWCLDDLNIVRLSMSLATKEVWDRTKRAASSGANGQQLLMPFITDW